MWPIYLIYAGEKQRSYRQLTGFVVREDKKYCCGKSDCFFSLFNPHKCLNRLGLCQQSPALYLCCHTDSHLGLAEHKHSFPQGSLSTNCRGRAQSSQNHALPPVWESANEHFHLLFCSAMKILSLPSVFWYSVDNETTVFDSKVARITN